MKILIDEQLPTKLKYLFVESGYEVFTVRDMKWLGTKNGKLLQLMKINKFDVLITNDKNLHYQQNIVNLKACIVNINSKTNRYEHVVEIIESVKTKLKEVETYLKDNSGGYFLV